MKGSLHTDELMHAVMRREYRPAHRPAHQPRLSSIAAPDLPQAAVRSDAAINIVPQLDDKVEIVRNAIDLGVRSGRRRGPRWRCFGSRDRDRKCSRRSTLPRFARWPIAGRSPAAADGPLAFDNAISAEAASKKGIVSPVAGRADILMVPNLEAGNMLAKQLDLLGGAQIGRHRAGRQRADHPDEPADSIRTRLASCAVAALAAQGPGVSDPEALI